MKEWKTWVRKGKRDKQKVKKKEKMKENIG